MDISPNKPNEDMEVVSPSNLPAHSNEKNKQLAIFSSTPITFERVQLKMAYGVGIGVEQGFSTGTLFLQSGPRDSAKCVKLCVPKLPSQKGDDPMNRPVVCIVLQARKFWREYPKVYVAGEIPREYDPVPGKPNEVPPQAVADGLRGDWLPDDGTPAKQRGPTVAKAIELGMLVRQPAGVEDDVFSLKLGGHWYAPAWFLADKQLCEPVSSVVDKAIVIDMQNRGVPYDKANLADSFMALTPFARLAKDGNVRANIVLGKHVEDGKPAKVPENLISDLLSRLSSMADDGSRQLAEASSDDRIPY